MYCTSVISVVLLAAFVYYTGIFHNNRLDESLLKGKNIVITGASSGIGEQLAYHYARFGANIFITARRGHLLEKVLARCRSLAMPTSKMGYLAADMSNEEDRERIIRTALELFGDIDQLILNHAHMSPMQVWEGSTDQVEQFKTILNVNTVSFVHLTSLALTSLKRTGGKIGVVGSFSGRVPTPYMLEYQASKFALDGFFSGLRHEFKVRKQNVSITHAIIGIVVTDNAMSSLGRLVNLMQAPEKLPLGKMPKATAEDAAYAIISATTQGDGELYFPRNQLIYLQCMLRGVFPLLLESFDIGY